MKLLVDTPEKVLFLSDKYDVFLWSRENSKVVYE